MPNLQHGYRGGYYLASGLRYPQCYILVGIFGLDDYNYSIPIY